LPTILEPFAQDLPAIGFRNVGLGIGLTVVRAIVEAHGGSVVAHSAGVGQGSRFTVTLPLAEPTPMPVPATPPAPSATAAPDAG
jgi:signal transduction histidine kinase